MRTGEGPARTVERRQVIAEAMARMRTIMDAGPSVENLIDGKAILVELAARDELFTSDDFPLPEDDAMDGNPLLHLHLYAKNFLRQGERWKYDPKTGAAERFTLDELGSINDAR